MSHLPYFIAAWIFLIGIYGVVTSRNLIHMAMTLAVIQSSTYVLLIGVGYLNHGRAPVFKGVAKGSLAVDPIVQAVMLTDIVVEATVAALILVLAIQAFKKAGTLDPNRVRPMKG
jgi:multicomponent Na+:H+ antiporter subunit C